MHHFCAVGVVLWCEHVCRTLPLSGIQIVSAVFRYEKEQEAILIHSGFPDKGRPSFWTNH
jgi:hypothetical protein